MIAVDSSYLAITTRLRRTSSMKMKLLKCLCLAIACSVGVYSAHAENSFFDSKEIQEFLHRSFDGKNSGMVIGVVDEHGSQVFAAGKLDNGTDQEVNGDTLFEIGSVTKTFTVLLLEDMVNRGEMKLDEPVENYLPKSVKVPSHGGKKITLLNLASQDSGLPHDDENMPGRLPNNMFAGYTADNLYTFLSGYSLTQDPGEKFRYSNSGIALLGNAIERKSGRDFESLVRERICTPLHMDSTYVNVPADLKPRLATGHLDDGNRHPGMILQVIIPAGGIRSTANDMLKYVSAHIGLRPNVLTALMQKTHPIRHPKSLDPIGGLMGRTAMPWYDQSAYQKPDMDFRGHAGGTAGFSAFAGFDLKRRRGVVVLANQKTRSQNIGWRILQNASLKDTNPETAEPILEVVGIGASVALDRDSKVIRILKIIPNSPAAEAGVTEGLIIQKIDDKQTAGLSLAECMKLLIGPAGSKVRLGLVDSKGKESKSVELTRQKFLVSS
jgi:D-alanyl-D-alanine-carboxypeptidase/D-alanyl-D-alanine-endopeptidase